MKGLLIEGFGWYGVAAILGAYVAVSFSLLETDSLIYQLLNATGALGIVIDAWYAKNYQPVVLNCIWAAVALVALLSILL